MPFLTSELSKGNWGSAFVPHGMRIKGMIERALHNATDVQHLFFFDVSKKIRTAAKTLLNFVYSNEMDEFFFQVNFSRGPHFKRSERSTKRRLHPKLRNIDIDVFFTGLHTTIILKQNDRLLIKPSPKLSKTLASLCLATFFHNILFDVNLFNKSGKPLPFEGPEFC